MTNPNGQRIATIRACLKAGEIAGAIGALDALEENDPSPDLLAAAQARLEEWHSDSRNMERQEPASVRLARAAIDKAVN